MVVHFRVGLRKRGRTRSKGRSVDPLALEIGFQNYQSSSDLSSPNETCYSFVRRAIQVSQIDMYHLSRGGERELSFCD